MNLQLKINSRVRNVKIKRATSRKEFSLDGQGVAADIVELESGVFSVLLGGTVFEVRVAPAQSGIRIAIDGHEYLVEYEDPRQWRRSGSGSVGAQGRQNITAPMPGKIVRLLVKNGDKVERGQGLLIIEAMKMQNEIKSPKEGIVERVAVAESQPVNAGEVLAVIA
ncbi:MAG TPA: biotin/lipoyl-containing protein [Candidatus Acidoferrales bacterium]|nr:biotin/lipoyl-containing protein [Candidatus Acidoferrales bacterium]